MFYKYENGQLISGNMVTAPSYILVAEDRATYAYPIDGWTWFDTDEEAQVLFTNLDAKQQLEYDLRQFALQKDIDVEEVAILLNSSNHEWVAQAQHFSRLYDASWQAFYAGTTLPELVW